MMTIFDMFPIIEQELDACIVLGPCQLEVMGGLRVRRGEIHVTKLNFGKRKQKLRRTHIAARTPASDSATSASATPLK